MENDIIEQSVPMTGGGGANAAFQNPTVPAAPIAPKVAPKAPVAKAPATLKPKNTAPAQASAMATFLKPSRTPINRALYNAEKLADIDGNLANRYISSDAEKDTDSRYALHTILTGGQKPNGLVPDDKSAVDIDTNLMRANIKDSKYNLSSDDQIKYGRAMQIFDTMKANNFQVMKGPGGVYWMESMENGKKVYASNGILEVADLLDKFSSPVSATGVPVPKKEVETNPKKLAKLINDDPNQDLFTESERWHMAALGTDLVSSLAGVTGKYVTAGTGGTGVLAGAFGVATGIIGGVAALGMSMYGDYLDQDVSSGEMWKNAGIRGGLEAMETVSIMPMSLMNSLRGASTAGKVLRKGMHLMMLKGTLDTAVGTDWEATMNKDTWEMEDYRKMATMAQFMLGAVGAGGSRYATRKGIQSKTTVAHEELGDYAKTVKPGKVLEAGEVAKARIPVSQAKLTKKTASVESAASLKHQDLAVTIKAEKTALRQRKSVEMKAAKAANVETLPAMVSGNHNPNVPALISGPPKVDVKTIQSKYRKEGQALTKQHTEAAASIDKTKAADIVKAQDKSKAVLERAASIRDKTDDNNISRDYSVKNAKDKASLDIATSSANLMHGTIIGNKLKARAEKRSGVSKEKLDAAKPSATAVVKSDTKLEGLAKEKVALEKKTKDTPVANRTPEDVAELKRITDGMAAEAKKSEGIRGAGTKLFSKVKEGSSLAGKGANKVVSIANVVPSSLMVRDGISSRAMARSNIYGEDVDELTGRRFYQYSLKDAKARLLEEGYTLSEINKYNLNQLRGALHTIESEAKNKGKKEPAKLATKKRPKTRHDGGVLNESSAAGLVRMFQEGGKAPMAFWGSGYDSERVAIAKKIAAEKVVADKRTALIARNKLTTAWNVKVNKINNDFRVRQAAKNKLKNVNTVDIKPVGDLTNVEIEAIKEAEVAKAPEKDKAAVAAKYDAIIAGADKAKANPWGLAEISKLTRGFKISDLFGQNRIHIESPVQDDMIAANYVSRGVRDMPGLQEGLNRTSIQQRVDSSDSFATNIRSREAHNDGEKRRSELVARNAGFVESSRDEENANQNRNIESAVNAYNTNAQRRNIAEANFSAQKVQAKAQKDQYDQQRKGRLMNAGVAGMSDLLRSKQTAKITDQYNDAASLKSKWNNEFKLKYDTAVAAGDVDKVKQIKSEFIQANKFDPDELDKQMMGYKNQFRALEQ